MTTSPTMPTVPRPRHFIHRSDGTITALVAVDELPNSIRLENVPSHLSQAETQGMTSLGVEEKSAGVYAVFDTCSTCASVIAPSERVGSDKTERALDRTGGSVVTGSAQSIADTNTSINQSASRTPANPVEQWRSSVGEASEAQVTVDPNLPSQSDNSHSITTNQRYNPTNPGIFRRKVYCTHWIRTGECDFTQQGCAFKHIMPDLDVLASLGYRDFPRWFREQNGMPAPMHDRRTAAHAPFARFNSPAMPSPVAPQGWPTAPPYVPPVPSAYPNVGNLGSPQAQGQAETPWNSIPPTPAYGRLNPEPSQVQNWSIAGTSGPSRASTPYGNQVYPPRMTYQQFMANPRRFPGPAQPNSGNPVVALTATAPMAQMNAANGSSYRQILARPDAGTITTTGTSGVPTPIATTNPGSSNAVSSPLRPVTGLEPPKGTFGPEQQKSPGVSQVKTADKLSNYETLTPQPHPSGNPTTAFHQPKPAVAAHRGLFDGAPPAPAIKHPRRFVAPDTMVDSIQTTTILAESSGQAKPIEHVGVGAAPPAIPTGPRAVRGGRNGNNHGSNSANRALANVASAVAGVHGGHRNKGGHGHANGFGPQGRKHKKSSPPHSRRGKTNLEEDGVLVDVQDAA